MLVPASCQSALSGRYPRADLSSHLRPPPRFNRHDLLSNNHHTFAYKARLLLCSSLPNNMGSKSDDAPTVRWLVIPVLLHGGVLDMRRSPPVSHPRRHQSQLGEEAESVLPSSSSSTSLESWH